MEEREIFFRRNDADTWALARLHHSLLLQIQDSPLWEREESKKAGNKDAEQFLATWDMEMTPQEAKEDDPKVWIEIAVGEDSSQEGCRGSR